MLDVADRVSVYGPSAGIGLSKDRRAQTKGPMPPAGVVAVSADSHLILSEDIWYKRFPPHLREKAPRIWYEEAADVIQIGFDGKSLYPDSALQLIRSIEARPSSRDMDARMQDLDAEGISKEIVFPQSLPMFFHWPDFEVREWIMRGYNQHLAELQSRHPNRFYGVAVANYWDPAKGADSIREIKDLGLKTFMVPMKPGKRADGSSIAYASMEMEPLWAAAEESGLPLCFHIGESFESSGINGVVNEALYQLGGGLFRRNFGEMTFGGVLDRHPALQIVFAEAGLNWIVGCLQDAEMSYDNFHDVLDYVPRHRPSYYWQNHCHATFMTDPLGLTQLDIIGADRAMWSADYPHNEGTFGYSRTSMQAVVDATSEGDARKILGENAIRVFNLQDV